MIRSQVNIIVSSNKAIKETHVAKTGYHNYYNIIVKTTTVRVHYTT